MNVRKQQVILAALRLFNEKGFSETSVQDIIEESNISKGTFYNYFSSKNDFLKAILDYAYNEEIIRRHELLIGQDKRNKDIFSKQILVRMEVNKEYNLLPIFEAIWHSGDTDLKKFVKKRRLVDMSWARGRLIDIYGENAAPYASDCAIMLYGMIHHLIQMWKAFSNERINVPNLIAFAMRRMDTLMKDMIATNDQFVCGSIFLREEENSSLPLKDVLLQLDKFKNTIKDDKLQRAHLEFVQFLIDELNSTNPRITIIQAVIRTLRETFAETSYIQEAQELVTVVWEYIGKLQDSTR